jgi:multidrug resistance protein, MATE family
MISKERIGTIFNLTSPMFVAQSSTLVMSLIDLIMVGRLGNNSIAAVGLSSFSNTLILAFVMGVAPAVQGLVARRRGEGSTEAKCLPLNGGILSVLVVGIPLTILCLCFSPFFFSMVSSAPGVTAVGVPFLRILYLGIIAAGMNNAFKGYWAGMENPKVYMMIALFMDGLNVVLNYILIFGHFGAPALGAKGAAIGTVVALHMGLLINFAIIYFRFRKDGFLKAIPGWPLLVSILKLGVPATMQEFFLDAGYLLFFWMLGRVGTAELAAGSVLTRLMLILMALSMSLGSASATLVSRTLGEGDPAGAARWGWDAGKLGVIGISLLGLPMLLFPKFVLSLFLTDPHTIAIATLPLRLEGATAGIFSLLGIFAYTLFSVGDGTRVMIVSFCTTWLIFLPAVWLVGPYLHYGLLPIILVQGGYSLLATGLITSFWAGGRWKTLTI